MMDNRHHQPMDHFKKIVILCDGVWQRRERQAGEPESPTNVAKVMRALLPVDHHSCHQLVYYTRGTGTGIVWDQLVGGALGSGLSEDLKDAYRFLANNYQEGDHLYVFGGSRGAYTARTLCGLIGFLGILDKSELEKLPEVYAIYRTPPEQRKSHKYFYPLMTLKRKPHVPIRFLGVWDTIGAYGIPVPGLHRLSRRWVRFHHAELNGHVQSAYQALAIDERRRLYAPSLWTKIEDHTKMEQDRQEVGQVWFPGDHSTMVGGKTPNVLSDVVLTWMTKRAERAGLEFDQNLLPSALQETIGQEDFSEALGRSSRIRSLLPSFATSSRPIGNEKPDHMKKDPGLNEMIHESALTRWNNKSLRYSPPNLRDALTRQVRIFYEPPETSPFFIPRRYMRGLVNWLGHLIIEEESTECRILDFSTLGGAKIKCEEVEIPDNLPVWLESEHLGKKLAQVVWREKEVLGLQFIGQEIG